jgi:hypothetical protein
MERFSSKPTMERTVLNCGKATGTEQSWLKSFTGALTVIIFSPMAMERYFGPTLEPQLRTLESNWNDGDTV